MKNTLKKILAVTAIVTVVTLALVVSAPAQYFAGTAPKGVNPLPNNSVTTLVVPLLTTNLCPASATTNLASPTSAIELPAGKDVGLLVEGYFTSNNVSFAVEYQLSPDQVHWSWPCNELHSGLVSSNTVSFKVPLVLSNSTTYPFTFFRVYAVKIEGTNDCYVSNSFLTYKSTPGAVTPYSR